MKKKNECEGFHCPEFVSAHAPDDFCIPEECCPPRMNEPKFPSPSDCLPEGVLEEFEPRIKAANQLLLDAALSGKREPHEIFQRAFDGLVGQKVRVELDCPQNNQSEKIVTVEGRVFSVGFDFVVLRSLRNREMIVPFEHVLTIAHSERFAESHEEHGLHDIDPCFRRRLTFNFGETVASSPELIQIFFRIRLKIYLLLLSGKKVFVQIDGEKMKGKIVDVHTESFSLCLPKKVREIPIRNICFIQVIEKEKGLR